ncbi:MAG: protocatechuate 3,4-dioxygenase subunit alpha [Nitriliruptorales bacterium]|nr:protocatechuate 3,4-dioxygenase subunit alpha [Nitriliruptorales bacterium]
MTHLRLTPPQTVGPFFHDCLLGRGARVVVSQPAEATIRIEGTLVDGAGQSVDDAMVEVWQADSHGRYHHPADTRDVPDDNGFIGYGRAATDEAGRFWFSTVKPGPVPGPDGRTQAPHLVVQVFARGLLDVLTTRLYFAGEVANDEDPVLQTVPRERRDTLLAQESHDDGEVVYRFDIVLQGEHETVFFDVGGRRRGR